MGSGRIPMTCTPHIKSPLSRWPSTATASEMLPALGNGASDDHETGDSDFVALSINATLVSEFAEIAA